MLDFVDACPEAKVGGIGAVGYCMSGPFVFAAAARFRSRVRCAASIHGVALVTDRDNSPHRTADRIAGEMYFACAETDRYGPRKMIDALEAHLATTAIRYRVEWYPGVEHGFVFPSTRSPRASSSTGVGPPCATSSAHTSRGWSGITSSSTRDGRSARVSTHIADETSTTASSWSGSSMG
jgi:dienelactone hydrolase